MLQSMSSIEMIICWGFTSLVVELVLGVDVFALAPCDLSDCMIGIAVEIVLPSGRLWFFLMLIQLFFRCSPL
jgi:hypothetical protein